MPHEPLGLGRALIQLASCLLVFNLLGWILFGIPLTLVPALGVVWVVGVIVGIFEPSRKKAMR